MAARKRQRLSPDDWIRAAIDVLRKQGPAGIRVARLADELGVTPGSFYWHFRDRADFRDRILEHWIQELLEGAAATVRKQGRAGERMRLLPGVLARAGLPDLDNAMRVWAGSDPEVRKAVKRADGIRLRHVRGWFEEAGLPAELAKRRAFTVMWTFAGSAGVDPVLRGRVISELIERLLSDAPGRKRG